MTADIGCGCGAPAIVARPEDNPPSQDAIHRRIGTHGTFLAGLEGGLSQQPGLTGLTARDESDPGIALLDAWAVVADVVAFYQERFANEAYLRTARERRSIAELARLVGYELRQGVAASVPLAFTLDASDPASRVVIPANTPAQSVPRPGELPQTFETSAPLAARAEWNALPVRITRPQTLRAATRPKNPEFYLAGITTNLRPGDPLLFVHTKTIAAGAATTVTAFGRVRTVSPDAAANRTTVTLAQPLKEEFVLGEPAEMPDRATPSGPIKVDGIFDRLIATRNTSLKNRLGARALPDATLRDAVVADTDLLRRLRTATQPDLKEAFHKSLRNQRNEPLGVRIFALRVTALLYGHNAQHLSLIRGEKSVVEYWKLARADADRDVAWLDGEFPQIPEQSWVVIDDPREKRAFRAKNVSSQARDDYYLPGKKTKLVLDEPWFSDVPTDQIQNGGVFSTNKPVGAFDRLKETTVHAAAEELTLADEPIPDDEVIGTRYVDNMAIASDQIELQYYVADIDPGRLLIVTGERADLPGVTGVTATELVRIKVVQQVEPGQYLDPVTGGKLPGKDQGGVEATRRYTLIQLDRPLAYGYRRSTVRVFGNVAWATHGETRDEILGNGDGSKAWLSFALRQFPITRLPAPIPSGSRSTLEVRVDRVLWHENARLQDAGPADHAYATRTDDQGKTTVTFGDGRYGARTPSGVENIRARFRVGLGTAGNVGAGRVMLLTQPPPGVQTVTNPLDANGGTDPEGIDRARRNAPLGTLTLGRVVSVRDYASFARTFAGIGKAESALLTAGHHRLIQLTVAGADDAPLAAATDLLANLGQALARNGNSRLPFRIDPRERVFVFLGAGVRIDPDYQWDDVRQRLRRALADAFPFEDRGLGRNLYLSEVVAALQPVAGVEGIEVDYFFGVAERRSENGERILLSPVELQQAMGRYILVPGVKDEHGQPLAPTLPPVSRGITVLPAGMDDGVVRPAQIAYFGPETLDELKATVSFRWIRT